MDSLGSFRTQEDWKRHLAHCKRELRFAIKRARWHLKNGQYPLAATECVYAERYRSSMDEAQMALRAWILTEPAMKKPAKKTRRMRDPQDRAFATPRER